MSYCCTSTSCAARREIRLAGASFALLFTAYNTAQNYLTTLLGQRFGSSVLALVYAGLICATPFAPSLVPRMGVRLALVLGSATYALLMAALTLFAGSGGGALVASLQNIDQVAVDALSWSPANMTELAIRTSDGTVALWDVRSTVLQPISSLMRWDSSAPPPAEPVSPESVNQSSLETKVEQLL